MSEKGWRGALGGLFLSALLAPFAVAEHTGDAELGRRIFRDGLAADGTELRGRLLGDLELSGAAVACATCHRRSGFGSVEGGAFVPPITAQALFQPTAPNRGDGFRRLYQEVQPRPLYSRARSPRLRPAYSDEGLRETLETGEDPTGRRLEAMMPRYDLDAETAAHLTAYLRTLAAQPAPGVDDSAIHFATVVTPDTPPERVAATLEVLEAYFQRKNLDTAALRQRPGHSPWHHDDFVRAYRDWQLHRWILRGPPESWNAQIRRYYRERPVFALLSGAGEGRWRPVHDFCEAMEVPCLFPNLDQPPSGAAGDYAVYFSEGLTLEGRVLAQHVLQGQAFQDSSPGCSGASAAPDPQPPTQCEAEIRTILQVFRDTPRSRAAATALRTALKNASPARVHLDELPIEGAAPPSKGIWTEILHRAGTGAVALWLTDDDLEHLPAALPERESPPEIFLSATLSDPELLPSKLAGRARLRWIRQFALAGQTPPRIYRARRWLQARGVAGPEERVRLNTFFTTSVTEAALHHLLERFSRDYFLEGVEHETENALNPGVFPHLSLGPGQRFASKGAFIVVPGGKASGDSETTSAWIVPGR